MGQEIVTTLTIDADTAGADQFSQAMDRSADSAQKGINSVQGYALAIAGVGIGVAAGFASLRGFVDYVGQQSQQLVDLATHADVAAMSVKEFQQTLYAARASGVSESDFFSGMDRIASDLAQASQKTTEFGELFRQNGISIKGANDQLITTKQALTEIMTLMQNASPVVQQRIAQIVGLSASWIPFLKEGTDQFEAQKRAAQDLGIIIDDATVAKAKEFNAEWKTAVAGWDLQFKASMAELLPLMVQLAGYAIKALDAIGSVYGYFSRLYTDINSQSLKQLNDTINQVYELTEIMGRANKDTMSGGIAMGRATNLKGLLGLPEDADIDQVFGYLDKLQKLYDQKSSQPDRIRVTPNYTTQLPDMDGTDAVDRAINSLQKHTAAQEADALAVGLGDAALARFRAEAQETAAILANGGKITGDQAAQFEKLKLEAYDAAGALAKARVAYQIDFDRKTAFFSQEDVQIASQLKGIYPDVAKAIDSTEAAATRINRAMKPCNDNHARNEEGTDERDQRSKAA